MSNPGYTTYFIFKYENIISSTELDFINYNYCGVIVLVYLVFS